MKNKLIILYFLLAPLVMFPASISRLPVNEPAKHAIHEPSPAAVRDAIRSWKMLSGKGKRLRMKMVRQELRANRAASMQGQAPMKEPLLIIIAILLPPLAIYLFEGEIRKCFWISILLTLLFWIPGVMYAIVIIHKDWKKYHPQ